MYVTFFFFQAEDGIRDLVRSRGLGDVYKRQRQTMKSPSNLPSPIPGTSAAVVGPSRLTALALALSLIHI